MSPDGEPPEASPLPETSNDYKERGNTCVRAENYTEAVLHYSFAIKLCLNDPVLYSNRSLAFLKLKQLYYANEDAEKAIQLKPDWAKGFFRKAEVQAAAGQFDTALLLYGRALQLQPNDISILNAAKRVAVLSNHENMYESRVPWVGAGIGIILGVIIVISDTLLTKSPTLKHPSLMVLMVIIISIVCYAVARLIRYYTKQQRLGLLDPPLDLLADFKKQDETDDLEIETPIKHRYSKAQARHRFKRGKT